VCTPLSLSAEEKELEAVAWSRKPMMSPDDAENLEPGPRRRNTIVPDIRPAPGVPDNYNGICFGDHLANRWRWRPEVQQDLTVDDGLLASQRGAHEQ
jgi:hypothetical protein